MSLVERTLACGGPFFSSWLLGESSEQVGDFRNQGGERVRRQQGVGEPKRPGLNLAD